jgi:DNA-binding transcriptional regulator YhcF (GntR family)
MIIDKMTNNYYKVLSYMYDNIIVLNSEYMIPYTQNELGAHTGINKVTINKLFGEYVEDALMYRKNSKYYFTEKAMRIMKKMKSIKE